MTTIEQRIEALEARIAELEEHAAETELARYRGRLDDLGVQAALARMEARDDVRSTLDRLEGLWSEARRQLDHLRSESRETGRGLTEGIRNAAGDLRSGFEDATATLRRRIDGEG